MNRKAFGMLFRAVTRGALVAAAVSIVAPPDLDAWAGCADICYETTWCLGPGRNFCVSSGTSGGCLAGQDPFGFCS